MIEIKNLYIKEINTTITYTIPDGINYLIAKNGSGKSLLLDNLALNRIGYNKEIDFNGQSNIYLRQNFYFNNKLTVKDYIEFILGINSQSPQVFINFLHSFNLQEFYKDNYYKKIGILSGGERQFLYLLSILCLDRDWYILDEPFNELDDEKCKQIANIILYLHKQEFKNFLITSHVSFPLIDFNKIPFSEMISP